MYDSLANALIKWSTVSVSIHIKKMLWQFFGIYVCPGTTSTQKDITNDLTDIAVHQSRTGVKIISKQL